ncbi:Exportin-5 [Wickerhamomyces ciferrii]|uniref:Exportin-5 n=1 Tax=Wickerhamomyces ciferrii (strain ATCC 14091 / BCRC 22168 / CBS 111 / JCM 3599 / NBRC 0793 / NRRL Y-1031 F-60-10) TaxID=1206466 RepID=K0KJ25_WICCF|nr:Exportin-5 [Wickerhamomyces ciferrii]CCH45230.1 Exportin-5 [Wickerhamomyces ciferrii]
MDNNAVLKLVNALELIHSPRTSNSERQEAQSFLEQVKKQEESPLWGYELALPTQSAIVRHFGLALLQNSINREWDNYDQEKKLAIRNWIVDLSLKLLPEDPHYLREKLAFLWVAVAKRCWGSYLSSQDDELANSRDFAEGWSSMDQDIYKLFQNGPHTRELSLIIYRTLFEDVYVLEDSITSRRNGVLNSLCTQVLLPNALLNEIYEKNANLEQSKATTEGWFLIWQELLNESIRNGDERTIIKVLETFKTCLNWPYSSLLTKSQIFKSLLDTVLVSNIRVKILSVDCLYILFTRSFNEDEDLEHIVGSIFKTEGIQLLANIYNSIQNDPDDIDDEIYAFTKKLTEMIVGLSEHLTKVKDIESDIPAYLRLVLSTTSSPSLTISGISLNFWGHMLREDDTIQIIDSIIPDLLEVAASKLLNYGDFNEDHISQKFLQLDFDSQSETFSFLSQYKRLVDDIIRLIVCIKFDIGIEWLSNRLGYFFSSEIGSQAISSPKLDYHGEAFILGMSQIEIVEASVRGIVRWKIYYRNADYDARLEVLLHQVEELAEKLLNVEIKDPVLLKRLGQTFVQFTPLLKDHMIFKIIERLLTLSTFPYPENANDDETNVVKDLRTSCATELNRIAFLIPDRLKNILDDLERVIESLIPKLLPTEAVTFKAFLLVVSQRASIQNKDEKFVKIVEPEIAAWTNPDTMKGLSDLQWFMERLGIVKIADYFKTRNISPGASLINTPMDEEGLKLKAELKNRWPVIFPARSTRLLLQYSIEKLPHDTPEYKNLLKLWAPRVTPIVPHILQLLYQIQAYHNPENWKGLPDVVQSFVKDSTVERFWQMGVSIQSRDSFLEESEKAMNTLRDFADSVGHIVRYTREYVFLTISSICQLEDTFYTIPNIANTFWRAATGEKVGITLHSWKHMINISLRAVIKNCPPSNVNDFMGQLLPQMFNTLDELLINKWEKVYISGLTFDENDDQLSEEMMEEHLLRQVTHVTIRLLVDCVGQYGYKSLTDTQKAIRKLLFSNKDVLAPFLNLTSHIIMLKDSRSSFNVLLILRAVLNDILLKDDEVDKFLCENLTKSLVYVLMDDFYREAHTDAGYLLTALYINLRVRGNYMSTVLKSYLPNATDDHISRYETALAESKNLKEQRNAVLDLIQQVKDEDHDDEKFKKNRNAQLESIAKKKKAESDMMNDPFTENSALGNLFGGEEQ